MCVTYCEQQVTVLTSERRGERVWTIIHDIYTVLGMKLTILHRLDATYCLKQTTLLKYVLSLIIWSNIL